MYLYPYKKLKLFRTDASKRIDTSDFKQDLSHAVSQTISVSDYNNHLKLQALVYDILPLTTAVFSYAIGPS